MEYTSEPITTLANDYLERANLVKRLAGLIQKPLTGAHIRIGLFGPWGCGKSSIIKIYESEFKKDDEIVIYFYPWQFATEQELTQGFIAHLNMELLEYVEGKERFGISEIASKAKKFVNDYKGKISKLIEMSHVKDLENDCLKTDGFITKLAQSILSGVNYTRDNLAEVLNKLRGKKVILVIEDIDRCKTKNIPGFLQFLREVFNANNCITILMADINTLKIAMQENSDALSLSEQSFIDKFFDVSINIGNVDEQSSLEFLKKGIEGTIFSGEQIELLKGYIPSNPRYLHRLILLIKEASKEASRYREGGVNLELLLFCLILEFEFPKLKDFVKENYESISQKRVQSSARMKTLKNHGNAGEKDDKNESFIRGEIVAHYQNKYGGSKGEEDRLVKLLMRIKSGASIFSSWEAIISYLDFIDRPLPFTDKDIVGIIQTNPFEISTFHDFVDEANISPYDAICSLVRIRARYCERLLERFDLGDSEVYIQLILNITLLLNDVIYNNVEDEMVLQKGVYQVIDHYRVWFNALSPHGSSLKDQLEKIREEKIMLLDRLKSLDDSWSYMIYEGINSVVERFRIENNGYTDYISKKIIPVIRLKEESELFGILTRLERLDLLNENEFTRRINKCFAKNCTFFKTLFGKYKDIKKNSVEEFSNLVFKFFYMNSSSSNSLLFFDGIRNEFEKNIDLIQELWADIDYSQLSPIAYWYKTQVEKEFKDRGVNLIAELPKK